ncbi:MAG TPA: DUF4233 domain-containing protein [Dermatophilaceae bacterium]|nr:DUF4233 domain-containing protein [Dermatophilaceae bacterium]
MSWMSAVTLYGVQGKMTRRLLGVAIGTQGLVVFFGALVARGLASARGSDTSGSLLLLGSVLAVLCILDAGLLRRPWGITAGWVLQVATLAFAFVVPVMLLVGLLFGALWLTALVQGQNMDEHTKRVDAQWHESHEKLEPSAQSEHSAQSRPSEPSPQDG